MSTKDLEYRVYGFSCVRGQVSYTLEYRGKKYPIKNNYAYVYDRIYEHKTDFINDNVKDENRLTYKQALEIMYWFAKREIG